MSVRPILRAVLRRGAVGAAVLLLGGADVKQPAVELVAPSTVSAGDTVEIVLRIRNDGPRPLDLELSGRPVGFDIVVTGADGAEVWRRLAGSAVGAALMLVTLQPGETRDFSAHWDQVDSLGRTVSPGRYILYGILPMGARRVRTSSRELVIEPNPASRHQR